MGVREITAEEAAKRRAAGMKKAPPSSGILRDFAEGVASAPAAVFDFMNKYAGAAENPMAPLRTNPPVLGPMAGRISEADTENPTRSLVAGQGVGGAVMSMPMVAATGGLTVPVAVSSMAGGAGGALASDEAKRRGYGPFAQFGAGLVGDVVTGGLTRAAIAAPGVIYDAVAPSARAGRYVAPLELGTETAEDAATGIRNAFSQMKTGVDESYDAYRAIPSDGTTKAEKFHRLAASQAADNAFSPEEIPSVTKLVPKILDDEVSVQDIERIRRGVSNTLGNQNVTSNTRRLAGAFNDVADEALSEIADQSGTDSAAAKALREAISKRRAMGKAFPEDSGLYDLILSPKSLSADESQAAFTKLINSPTRKEEIRLAMQAVSGNDPAKRGLRKALALGIINSAEETATNKVSSALERATKAQDALREAFGDAGYEHFRKLLSEAATANRSRGWFWRAVAAKGNPIKGTVAGGVVGGWIGGGPGANVGMATGAAIDLLAQQLGPRAVREIAVQSLFDPDLYRQITRDAPKGVKAAEWTATMVGSLVRRGILTNEEASGETAKADQ